MKRKIAILLATVMTATAVPTSIFAANTKAPALEGSVSNVPSGAKFSTPVEMKKTLANREDVNTYKNALSKREGVLKIELNAGNSSVDIKAGDSFDIKLENASFNTSRPNNPEELAYKNASYSYDSEGSNPKAKVFYVDENGKLQMNDGSNTTPIDSTDLSVVMNNNIKPLTGSFGKTTESGNLGDLDTIVSQTIAPLAHIPYSIEVKDDKTATVKFLTDVTFKDIDSGATKVPNYYKKNSDGNKVEGAGETAGYLAIPLGDAITVEGGEEVKVNIIGYNSDIITDGTVTLAKIAGSGSTSINTKYIEKKVFEDKLDSPSDIIIQENVQGTFSNDGIVTIRLSNGFEFVNKDFTVKDASSGKDLGKDYGFVTTNGSEDKTRLQFKLTDLDTSNRKESLRIKLPAIQPVNADKNYGEVSVSVYGGGITEESVVIAERQTTGVKLETKTEVPTITKGRYTTDSKANDSAEFELSELVPNSLLNRRSVDFKVPEGVKIVDATVVSTNNLTIGTNGDTVTRTNEAFDIVNDGTTLRLNRDKFEPSKNSAGKIRLKLKLSVDAGYKGEDITLTVNGGGISEELKAVIAKVENPFTVTAQSKDINIGYQNYSVNDITITETKPGMFMEGENVEVSLTAPYGTQEMGFTKAKVESTGNLEIKAANGSEYLSTGSNKIVINIKAKSTKEPASIKISNVEIGTTRSVPFGAYNLVIGGKAVINNDLIVGNDLTVDDKKIEELKASINLDNTKQNGLTNKQVAERIDASNGSYKVEGYVNVVTAVDTIDKEMKVTIGSTTAIIDGKEVAMDVAPYIQANGNTMVPLRFVTVALTGGDASSVDAAQNSDKVSWDATTKTVTIFYGAGINQKIIQFKIGSPNMIVDGNSVPMENGAKAEIQNGRTFVPFRSLGQALGIPVSWDATTKTAVFNSK